LFLFFETFIIYNYFSNGSSAAQDSFISKRLTAIYAELASIEADKAESRAAVILNGLGFNPQMQSMATK
jgi:ATP-binding cassette subfamily F protein 3